MVMRYKRIGILGLVMLGGCFGSSELYEEKYDGCKESLTQVPDRPIASDPELVAKDLKDLETRYHQMSSQLISKPLLKKKD